MQMDPRILAQKTSASIGTHTPAAFQVTTKDQENRRIPFDPNGRLAAVLRRRGKLGLNAFVFGN
jgi:hypothetical protein